MDKTINYLLQGEPWVVYRTRIDLLEQNEKDSEVQKARTDLINHPKIQPILKELQNWPGTVLNSHRSANQTYHKLSLIADLGFNTNDSQIDKAIQKIFEHQSEEGPFQLSMNIPSHFGGSGKNEWAWALCDAPVILYSLIKFGFEKDKRIQKAVKYLVSEYFLSSSP